LLRWGWFATRHGVLALMITWGTLVIFYSNLPWASAQLALAIVFAAFCVWAVWVTRQRRMRWAFAGAMLAVIGWYASIPPSHDRPWRQDVKNLPRAVINGDHVRMEGVRNFTFRSRDDFDSHYESREFLISRAESIDFYISYWHEGPVAHTFVSFIFDDDTPPLCISIETRPEIGEGFDPIASLFKQFELIYIVGDEHDLVGSRASHRDEEVFLYRLRAPREGVQRLLRYYLERINEIHDRPEWYHLLKNSCTVNIFRYANAAGREGRFDIRQLINGWVDRYLFRAGRIDTSMPFRELRERSRITRAAQDAAYDPNFSALIREGLPKPEPFAPTR
jgi:hypothetical protein